MGEKMETMAKSRCFGGWQLIMRHHSAETKTPMRFALYLPPDVESAGEKAPVIWWLSGLTCTEENFTVKAGAQKYAAENGVIIIAPDTSPRGAGIDGEDESYDFGTGAGFYVDALVPPWDNNYRMFSYITGELPEVVAANFPQADMRRQSIMGHSMGGHGALILALKTPGRYRAVSAFAPICNPSECAWGQKALSGYLGDDKSEWQKWDAAALIKAGAKCPPIVVEQGEEDEFLPQLMPDALQAACEAAGQPLTLNRREGYDHSYYFIATFLPAQITRHAKILHE